MIEKSEYAEWQQSSQGFFAKFEEHKPIVVLTNV